MGADWNLHYADQGRSRAAADRAGWRVFVEANSVVEQILFEDPAKCYQTMDFATRDRYRQVVDRLAKRSDLSEAEIARAAIGLASAEPAGASDDAVKAHVGFYLIDQGIGQLEDLIKVRQPLLAGLRRRAENVALPLYLSAIGLMTLVGTAGLLGLAAAGLLRWAAAGFENAGRGALHAG